MAEIEVTAQRVIWNRLLDAAAAYTQAFSGSQLRRLI